MISYHKAIFFDCNALAEANRYEAALFAAVEYNRPQCVEVMLNVLGPRDVYRHDFYTSDNQTEQLSAAELARARGVWSPRSSLECCFCHPHNFLSSGVGQYCLKSSCLRESYATVFYNDEYILCHLS